MHGFTTDGYHTLSGSKLWMHARGNIFSGNAAAIEAGARAYERSLEDSLAHGFMGTEESALTLAIMRSPTLFHVTPLFVALSFTLQSSIDAFNFFLFAPDADNQQRLRRSRASMPHVPHAFASPRRCRALASRVQVRLASLLRSHVMVHYKPIALISLVAAAARRMPDLAKAFVANPVQERARRCLCKVTAASQIAVCLLASCINLWSIPLLP